MEQLSVEQEASYILLLIESASGKIQSIASSSIPTRKSTVLSLSARGNTDIKQLTQSSLEDLGATLEQVKEIHNATAVERRVKRGVTLGAINYLKKMEL